MSKTFNKFDKQLHPHRRWSNRYAYNRAYVKKLDCERLPFGRAPHDSYCDWEYYKYPAKFYRFLEMHVGKPYGDLLKKLCTAYRLSGQEMEEFMYREWFGRYRSEYFVDDSGIIRKDGRRYNRGKRAPVEVPDEYLKWNRSHAPKNLDKCLRQTQTVLGKYWYYAEGEWKFGTVLHQEIRGYKDGLWSPSKQRKYNELAEKFRRVLVPGLHLYYEGLTLEPRVQR